MDQEGVKRVKLQRKIRASSPNIWSADMDREDNEEDNSEGVLGGQRVKIIQEEQVSESWNLRYCISGKLRLL